jgi:hypothetical protein
MHVKLGLWHQEKNIDRVFEDMVLRRIFELKMDDIIGDLRTLQITLCCVCIIFILFLLTQQINGGYLQ